MSDHPEPTKPAPRRPALGILSSSAARVANQPTKTVKRLIHKLEHLLGWNGGRVETWYSSSGRLMVGFRCDGCGKLEGIHPAQRICQKGVQL